MICILVTAGSCPQSQIKGTKGKMVLARVIDHHTREGTCSHESITLTEEG